MRILDVDPSFITENDNTQLAQLNQLLTTAKEPWEAAQYKWRIQNLQNSISLGKGVPTTASGQVKPVVDARTWMKQNPSVVKSLPKEALPPEMQQPGMLNRISNAVGSAADAVFNYADQSATGKARDDLKASRQAQGLQESTELDRIKHLSKVLRG